MEKKLHVKPVKPSLTKLVDFVQELKKLHI